MKVEAAESQHSRLTGPFEQAVSLCEAFTTDWKPEHQHAQSLRVRGKLAKQLGLPEGDEQVRTAEAALDAIEMPVRALAGGAPGAP